MRVVLDVETNGLKNATQIWCVVFKDLDTGKINVFRNVTNDPKNAMAFVEFTNSCTEIVGHHCISFDIPTICNLVPPTATHLQNLLASDRVRDTYLISRLVDYSRPNGHSIEAYGEEFGLKKGSNDAPDFFKKWSQELEDYCVRDVEICEKIYIKFKMVATSPDWAPSVNLEHQFQKVCNDLHHSGFYFDKVRAENLLQRVEKELGTLDEQIHIAFPRRLSEVRCITPRLTKFSTLNKSDFRFEKSGDLSEYNGGPFTLCEWIDFNPASHRQVIDVLNTAGWKPTEKTKTHVETEREHHRLKYAREQRTQLDLNALHAKLQELGKTGWKINEENLSTLPIAAPPPARLLAKRILYESRRRTLTEWLGLVQDDHRIHGEFQAIGAWTHRMAHQRPNTANIPNEHELDGTKKLLGKELRSLWCVPKNRLLVGVDAEGIQLRIFAHYIDDKEFTEALVNGRKEEGTDPHSINKRILGPVCRSRDAAKRFIFALLLGAGIGKLAEILQCTTEEAREALDRLTKRYAGFDYLKREVIPSDAKRGWFKGLDGRKVVIPGDTVGQRRHLCMSGYLQNGEAVVMKMATLLWMERLDETTYLRDYLLVNLVHDEWQVEIPNNVDIALGVAGHMAKSLTLVGEHLKLKCPLAGSYYDAKRKDYTFGTRWSVTH